MTNLKIGAVPQGDWPELAKLWAQYEIGDRMPPTPQAQKAIDKFVRANGINVQRAYWPGGRQESMARAALGGYIKETIYADWDDVLSDIPQFERPDVSLVLRTGPSDEDPAFIPATGERVWQRSLGHNKFFFRTDPGSAPAAEVESKSTNLKKAVQLIRGK